MKSELRFLLEGEISFQAHYDPDPKESWLQKALNAALEYRLMEETIRQLRAEIAELNRKAESDG